jgi:hypothetical protein
VITISVIAGAIALYINVIAPEIDRGKIEIENYLNQGKCNEASAVYTRTLDTLNKIGNIDAYYSVSSSANRISDMEIAECFTKQNDYKSASQLINIDKMFDVFHTNEKLDYYKKAQKIFENSGEQYKAKKAQEKVSNIEC